MIDCFRRILKIEVLGRKNTAAVIEAINEAWGEDTTLEEMTMRRSYVVKYLKRCVREEE
jgi:hypothetical protein